MRALQESIMDDEEEIEGKFDIIKDLKNIHDILEKYRYISQDQLWFTDIPKSVISKLTKSFYNILCAYNFSLDNYDNLTCDNTCLHLTLDANMSKTDDNFYISLGIYANGGYVLYIDSGLATRRLKCTKAEAMSRFTLLANDLSAALSSIIMYHPSGPSIYKISANVSKAVL